MTFDAAQLRNQIPYYLTSAPEQKAFIYDLEQLLNGAKAGYFAPNQFDMHRKEMLQGDGWGSFSVYSFKNSKLLSTRGIVISNSCDISVDNKRHRAPRVIFSPIIKLSAFEKRLIDLGIENKRIEDILSSIRRQHSTNTFYLPAEAPLEFESVVFFDDMHSMPLSDYNIESKSKIFTLTMAGFYLLIFKLSIHFCRLQENVIRNISSHQNK
ncbi:MAG: hypothetical protein LCH39_04025 [Proteobacteria bacterium]|nr:hypothetical protein [Pseudomonadota bacterium]